MSTSKLHRRVNAKGERC